ALSEVVSRLDGRAADGHAEALAILTTGRPSHRQVLFDQFAARFGAPPPLACDLFDEPVLRRANGLSFAHRQLPTIDLAHTRLLLSLGTYFRCSWNSPVSLASFDTQRSL